MNGWYDIELDLADDLASFIAQGIQRFEDYLVAHAAMDRFNQEEAP